MNLSLQQYKDRRNADKEGIELESGVTVADVIIGSIALFGLWIGAVALFAPTLDRWILGLL